MANHGGSGGHSKRASSTPVKWTLVEAEPETPQGRKQGGYARSRAQASGGGGSGSGSSGNWRSSTRDGMGRGRGGGHNFSNGHRGNRRGGGTRSNHGHGRGRGYGNNAGNGMGGAYVGGATYYGNRDYGNGNQPSLEEQKAYKAYMTSMAVRQIEFYFTVENLCRDIFMRSYMDEEGYIPIAFVANFPGVARFGVELPDIIAGILLSDSLQVDVDNETMRMKEGWQVWLLPNQATGRQGVPRYIKVDPSTVAEEPPSAENPVEPEPAPEETGERIQANIEPTTEGSHSDGRGDANAAEVLSPPQSNGEQPVTTTGKDDGENTEGASQGSAVNEHERSEDRLDGSEYGKVDSAKEKKRRELTPTAPAWTPSGSADTDTALEQVSAADGSSAAVPSPNEGEVCAALPEVAGIRKSKEDPVGDDIPVASPDAEPSYVDNGRGEATTKSSA